MLSSSLDHAIRAGLLRALHKDSFGRMLTALAKARGSAISNGPAFRDYRVLRIWSGRICVAAVFRLP